MEGFSFMQSRGRMGEGQTGNTVMARYGRIGVFSQVLALLMLDNYGRSRLSVTH